MLKTFTSAVALLALLPACGKQATSSSVHVVNGIAIKETEEPAVRMIKKTYANGSSFLCTGTFLNSQTLLTAAHCVDPEKATHKVYIDGRAVSATQVYRHPLYAAVDSENGVGAAGPYDLALIAFPEGTSPYSKDLRRVKPQLNEDFKTIGYGQVKQRYNTNTRDWEGISSNVDPATGRSAKTTGSNRIAQVSNGMVRWSGVTGYENNLVPGKDISVGSGDSGGPLTIDGKLAGVASYVSFEERIDPVTRERYQRNWSNYVDINSNIAQKFLRSAADAGLVIPGYSTPLEDIQLATRQEVVQLDESAQPKFRWTVSVDGDLDKVSCITYKLHPTFNPPEVTSCDRANHFAITRTGWGGFTLNLDVKLNNGTVLAQKLSHKLVLKPASPGIKAEDFRILQGNYGAPLAAVQMLAPAQPVDWVLWLVADEKVKAQVACVSWSRPATRICDDQTRTLQAYRVKGQDAAAQDVTVQIELKNGRTLTLAHRLQVQFNSGEVLDEASEQSCSNMGLQMSELFEDMNPVEARTPHQASICVENQDRPFDVIVDRGINYVLPHWFYTPWTDRHKNGSKFKPIAL